MAHGRRMKREALARPYHSSNVPEPLIDVASAARRVLAEASIEILGTYACYGHICNAARISASYEGRRSVILLNLFANLMHWSDGQH